MTEAEWLQATDPIRMLEILGNNCSKRKLRLFIADGVKALVSIFGKDEEVLAEMHERVAEGQASEEDLERFLLRNMPDLWEHRAPGGNLPSVWDTARMVVHDRFKLAPLVQSEAVNENSRVVEYAEMCRVLRCIFGSPFHTVTLDLSWLTWHGGLLVSMARQMYDSRDFSDMPVLADALEESGCQDQDILGHCRSGVEHVRGCWVVDLILGRS